jgi:hypothetical protein
MRCADYSTDTVYVVCFSLLMLSVDLSSPHVKNKMSKREFIRNTRRAVQNVNDDFIGHLYDNVYLVGPIAPKAWHQRQIATLEFFFARTVRRTISCVSSIESVFLQKFLSLPYTCLRSVLFYLPCPIRRWLGRYISRRHADERKVCLASPVAMLLPTQSLSEGAKWFGLRRSGGAVPANSTAQELYRLPFDIEASCVSPWIEIQRRLRHVFGGMHR